jgi:dipeptidyl aminopeptidase/acylaminoacyl peptidase
VWVDKEKIGIWAHSNGGQMALSVLEISGENYPTILWAPMTNPFPQSVLDTADDLDDKGVTVKKAIAEFEKKYDSRRYAFENYYQWINAPVVIYQGTADEWVKVEWQERVVRDLEALGKTAELKVLAGDDHNLSKNWEEVVRENIEWYHRKMDL